MNDNNNSNNNNNNSNNDILISSLFFSSILFPFVLFCYVLFCSSPVCSVLCPYSSPMPSFSPVSSFLLFSSPLFIHLSALLPHPHPLLSSPLLSSSLTFTSCGLCRAMLEMTSPSRTSKYASARLFRIVACSTHLSVCPCPCPCLCM